ncbi:MAG: hypothetical protein A2Y90_05140 [Chloroflexi bacterium RBG_13_52_12]|nr:MAG: hypothetical protein A2Y90_05140 [Chloroflexi bacterium RBG_13_52_12]
MFVFFLFLGLVFLISGGVGLFYVNAGGHVAAGTPLIFIGNLTFGTFAFFGVLILIFLAFFNAEFD